MTSLSIVLAIVAGFIAAVLILKVMVNRVDDACRLAELVADTRRLRTRYRTPTALARGKQRSR